MEPKATFKLNFDPIGAALDRISAEDENKKQPQAEFDGPIGDALKRLSAEEEQKKKIAEEEKKKPAVVEDDKTSELSKFSSSNTSFALPPRRVSSGIRSASSGNFRNAVPTFSRPGPGRSASSSSSSVSSGDFYTNQAEGLDGSFGYGGLIHSHNKVGWSSSAEESEPVEIGFKELDTTGNNTKQMQLREAKNVEGFFDAFQDGLGALNDGFNALDALADQAEAGLDSAAAAGLDAANAAMADDQWTGGAEYAKESVAQARMSSTAESPTARVSPPAVRASSSQEPPVEESQSPILGLFGAFQGGLSALTGGDEDDVQPARASDTQPAGASRASVTNESNTAAGAEPADRPSSGFLTDFWGYMNQASETYHAVEDAAASAAAQTADAYHAVEDTAIAAAQTTAEAYHAVEDAATVAAQQTADAYHAVEDAAAVAAQQVSEAAEAVSQAADALDDALSPMNEMVMDQSGLGSYIDQGVEMAEQGLEMVEQASPFGSDDVVLDAEGVERESGVTSPAHTQYEAPIATEAELKLLLGDKPIDGFVKKIEVDEVGRLFGVDPKTPLKPIKIAASIPNPTHERFQAALDKLELLDERLKRTLLTTT